MGDHLVVVARFGLALLGMANGHQSGGELMNFVYDIETYRNMFSCGIVHMETKTRWIYEVSDRRNHAVQFCNMIRWLRSIGARMIGFNNEGFDWPVCQYLMDMGDGFTAEDAYYKAQAIISSQNRFGSMIWPDQRYVTQIDLFKIHHFDNMSKSTSLKKLEINMRLGKVIDLPYSPHEHLSDDHKDEVIAYMCHDIDATMFFAEKSADQIAFRDSLPRELGDVLNFNDTKIGKKYFENKLGQDVCFERVDGRRQPRQTIRSEIRLAEIISPKIVFGQMELVRVLAWLKTQTLRGDMTKGVFETLSATVDGFTFHFGTGGIHGSISDSIVVEDDEYEIVDVDVASFYPNLAIANRWSPAHLGESFCDIYLEVFEMRKKTAKNSAENAMLKLALNGVYGASNDKYSPFYDPAYTMAITINGQLFLCMLAENLMAQGHSIIQANTDGVTFKVKRSARARFDAVCKTWEAYTGLTLEAVNYHRVFIRDVNSYIAEKRDGKLKRIGAYAYETALENPFTRELLWHKDHSNRVSIMAAEAAMLHGTDPLEFIRNHRDPFDFMLSIKVPRNGRLEASGRKIQNTTRYYVSTVGEHLEKILPEERRFAIQKGYTVTIVNDVECFKWETVNWYFYLTEANKLRIGGHSGASGGPAS